MVVWVVGFGGRFGEQQIPFGNDRKKSKSGFFAALSDKVLGGLTSHKKMGALVAGAREACDSRWVLDAGG